MFSHIDAIRDLWRTRRARSAAIATLRPFEASLHQAGAENPQAFDSAYLIGFLIAAVSGVARNASPALSSEGIGAVQLDVCAGLTGLPQAVLAERMVSLSLGADSEFVRGCSDAADFTAAVTAAAADGGDAGSPSPAAQQAQALWERFLERWTSGPFEG
jgi:hypothetical protein